MAPLSPWMLGCLGIVLLMSNECSTTCVYEPTIRVSGVFLLGETKELLCTLVAPVSQRNVTFRWSLNGTPLLFDVLSTNTNGDLVARQIRLSRVVLASDEGQIFNCTAYFNSELGNEKCSSSYKIQSVYTAPNKPVIIGPSAVLGGGDATWLCYSDGATGTDPSIVWRYGNGSRVNIDLYSQTTNTYNSVNGLDSYNVSSQLTLPITSGAPNFALECEAVQTNSGQSSKSVLSIMVTYPPLVTVAKTNYTGTTQTAVTLLCSVTAAPAVTVVSWYKDDVHLETRSARYSGSIPCRPSLTIRSLVKSDRGTYVCQATNSVGSGNSTEVQLVVRYGPSVTYSENTVGGVIGGEVTVSCLVDALPQYSTVLWYRLSSTNGAETLLNPANNSGKYSGGTAQTTPNVTIKNLDTSDQGLYKCKAYNDVGYSDGGNVRVEIYYTPSTPIVTKGCGVYKEGESITLICNSTAYPLPEFRWYQGTELKGTGPVLNLGFASPGDAGQYKCEVFNPAGSDHISVTVVVFYKPRAWSISNVTATVGQTVTLTCDTDAYPPPNSYTWTKAGVTKSGSSSSKTLTLTVEDSGDFGRYDCVASNQEGTSDPIAVFILENETTESTGLSSVTLILIIITCLINVVLIILIICITKWCSKPKDNNRVSPRVPPSAVPKQHPSKNSTISARSSHVSPVNDKRTTPRVDMEDKKPKPPQLKGPATQGHGMSISLPGPRPHHLPPLGQEGTAEETESARDDEPKKRQGRHYNDDLEIQAINNTREVGRTEQYIMECNQSETNTSFMECNQSETNAFFMECNQSETTVTAVATLRRSEPATTDH